MIRVSIMYPNGDDIQFNMDYYLDTHMPMVTGGSGDALKKYEITKPVASGDQGPPAFVCMLQLYFESVEAFGATMKEHGGALMADIPNFTNTQPVVQVEELVVAA